MLLAVVLSAWGVAIPQLTLNDEVTQLTVPGTGGRVKGRAKGRGDSSSKKNESTQGKFALLYVGSTAIYY